MAPLDQAIEKIKDVKYTLIRNEASLLEQQVDAILDFVQQKAYTSLQELHRGLEQLFVDMLNDRLAQLPGAILKEINESSPEDLEKKAQEALEVVSKIQQLEGLIQWSFLAGTTITSLITEAPMVDEIQATPESNNNDIAISDANTYEIQITENQSNKPFEGSTSTHGLATEGDVGAIASIVIVDEIIQIE
ncbi:hypothetical protein Sjap_000326 [Stephania japonica]|uniref:Uncharacterized protein n=1 Tax=Stephania japonica TaxID=461633 RepID=A0AAP0PTX0_9MAGN